MKGGTAPGTRGAERSLAEEVDSLRAELDDMRGKFRRGPDEAASRPVPSTGGQGESRVEPPSKSEDDPKAPLGPTPNLVPQVEAELKGGQPPPVVAQEVREPPVERERREEGEPSAKTESAPRFPEPRPADNCEPLSGKALPQPEHSGPKRAPANSQGSPAATHLKRRGTPSSGQRSGVSRKALLVLLAVLLGVAVGALLILLRPRASPEPAQLREVPRPAVSAADDRTPAPASGPPDASAADPPNHPEAASNDPPRGPDPAGDDGAQPNATGSSGSADLAKTRALVIDRSILIGQALACRLDEARVRRVTELHRGHLARIANKDPKAAKLSEDMIRIAREDEEKLAVPRCDVIEAAFSGLEALLAARKD